MPPLPELQKQIAELNARTPDRAVVPVLGAGATPGTVDLTLKVDDHLPLHYARSKSTTSTPRTPRSCGCSDLSRTAISSIASTACRCNIRPRRSEPSELGVFAANFATHVGDGDKQLALYYVHSDSDVASLGTLSVLGRARFSARWIVPIVNDATAASHRSPRASTTRTSSRPSMLDPQ